MKIGGVKVEGPAEEVLVLPRLGDDIIIRCIAVLDMAPFHGMCPPPMMKKMIVAGGVRDNDKDPGYLEQCEQHAQLRFAYIALKSLEPSDIEWSTVKMGEPATWSKWENELREAGISSIEINRIVACIMQANCLDEGKLALARDSFLRGMEESKEKSSGSPIEPQSTQSGTPVNASE